jgi:hypothetical protein
VFKSGNSRCTETTVSIVQIVRRRATEIGDKLSTQLHRLNDVEISLGDRVFRYSPVPIALLWVVVVCVDAASVLIDWEGRRRSAGYIAYYIAAVSLVGLVLMRRLFQARLRSSNWLVRMRSDGLLIQFRSYLNYHLHAEDATVIFIPYRDIQSARMVLERAKIESQDGTTQQTRRLVEFALAGDLTPFAKALAAESAKPGPREKTWYGNTATLYRHYPVRMVSSPFLQVEWSVVPCAKTFLDALRPYTTIAPSLVVTEDFLHIANLSRKEQERRLRELDQRGQRIAAVYIATRIYGYDLTQATAFIEGLRPRS